MMTLIYAIAIGLSIGATAMVARRIGEHDPDGAARAAMQSVFLGLLVAIVLALVGAPLAPKLLGVMGAAPSVVEHGVWFTRIMLGCNATVVMLFMINAIFRGAGDAAIAMRVLWLANALNIVLGPCFIFGLVLSRKSGSPAAPLRPTIDAATAASIASTALFGKGGRLEFTAVNFRLE